MACRGSGRSRQAQRPATNPRRLASKEVPGAEALGTEVHAGHSGDRDGSLGHSFLVLHVCTHDNSNSTTTLAVSNAFTLVVRDYHVGRPARPAPDSHRPFHHIAATSTEYSGRRQGVGRRDRFPIGEHTMMLRRSLIILATTLSALGCGGSPYYVGSSTARFAGAGTSSAPPTIIRAPGAEGGTPLRSVAVMWPDACTSTSYGAASGTAPNAAPVIAMDCGVLMESIEVALNAAGFRVVSWDAVRRRALAGELSPEQAAAALGVQGLIRIVTLESSEVVESVEFARTLHHADRNGQPVGAPLDPSRAAAAAVFPQLEQGIAGVVRRSVTLVAVLSLVPSGEVAWHFRGTMVEAGSDGSLTRRALIECGDEIGCVIRSAQSEGEAPTAERSGDAADPAAAARFALLEQTFTAFAAALHDGRVTHHCIGLDGSCGSGQQAAAPASEPGRGR